MGNGFNFPGQKPAALEPPPITLPWLPPPQRRRVWLPLLLFGLTILSTLAVGAHLSRAYQQGLPPYPEDFSLFGIIWEAIEHPAGLLSGWAFALTLMGILGIHELGHFFAARYHGIHASYPYFLPAPTLIGTVGAFIRLQSPILDRRALFDVGIAGPLAGFVVAVPALALGLATSKVIPAGMEPSAIVFGNPPLVWLMTKLFWPGVPMDQLAFSPMALAAWVGLFATALNLLPIGQLDGGHILYAFSARRHKILSRIFLVLLLVIGAFGFQYPETVWPGWLFWGGLLLILGVRHPAVLNPARKLDRNRVRVAFAGLAVFLLCFTPAPFYIP